MRLAVKSCEDQKKLAVQLQNEKVTLTRQMVMMRSRLTKISGEKAGAQNQPEDVCRLLKRIRDLESQLAVFHRAEKPTGEEKTLVILFALVYCT